jgi:methyl-accepting chemotaxis protein
MDSTNDVEQSQAFDLARFRAALDGTLTAIMMVDRDLVITYVNQATMTLLRKHATVFHSLYRGFQVERIVGTCIDIFHKDASHQRRILGDPNNLPYTTDIHVGPITFQINVTAQYDHAGAYIGNTLEWYDVGVQRLREGEVTRLSRALENAESAFQICDKDLKIVYMNQRALDIFTARAADCRKRWPGFDPNKLVGSCIDGFHRDAAHQRKLLSDPSRLPFKAEGQIGDFEFQVNASYIADEHGQYAGNMVEWKDITEQKEGERQLQALVEAAARGDLNNRIDIKRFQGFMRTLAERINEMLDTIVAPVKDSIEVVGRLAEGDLSQTIESEYQGDFALLVGSINTCIDNLRHTVSEIRDTAENIGISASQVAEGNSDLSQRTEEQASSLEETASSLEEMTGTVKQNADNAFEANKLAGTAREHADRGGSVVTKAIAAMSEINVSSKKIADIIGVIDEIAFQTNLLALNAAVEAARAGEQGRGFAVVASEVRNLAQRAAAAAKEIKSLIKDSVQKVEEGAKLVDESGATLTEIVGSVKRVSDLIAEIAGASREQSIGIEQINRAVVQMDQTTQQNAALVEEMASASESMEQQARALEELVGFFYLDETQQYEVERPPAGGHRPGGGGEAGGGGGRQAPSRRQAPAALPPPARATRGTAAPSPAARPGRLGAPPTREAPPLRAAPPGRGPAGGRPGRGQEPPALPTPRAVRRTEPSPAVAPPPARPERPTKETKRGTTPRKTDSDWEEF